MMNDDMDMKDSVREEGEPLPQVAPWLPRVVVTITLAGFFALAWYAYRTGTQSIQGGELVVVEADKSPIKEKPDDPGGMKFPNQDKTIFETFANNPQVPPKVERVMPPPEEPMSRQLDTADTKTWVNKKLYEQSQQAPAAGNTEQVIGEEQTVKAPEPAEALAALRQQKPSPVDAKTYDAPKGAIVSYKKPETPEEKAPAAAKEEPKEAVKAESKQAVKKEEPPKPAAKVETKPVSSPGSAKVQLGAYRSEKEARDAFAAMQKEHALLDARSPIIMRADLGDKGVFYRLRLGGFSSTDDARGFCKRLTAKGQACIPAN